VKFKLEWTIPNILTFLRLLAIPVFMYLLVQPDLVSRAIAFALFLAAALTDLVDGYIARKYQQESELGKFLDPLADKALVVAALLVFIFLSAQVQLWMVICIVGRDVLITFLRSLAIRKGKSLRTSVMGKVKTAFQMFAISVIIISFLVISYRDRGAINAMYATEAERGRWAVEVATHAMLEFARNFPTDRLLYDLSSFGPYYLMLLTTIFTVISGLRYLFTNFALLGPPYDRVPRARPGDGAAPGTQATNAGGATNNAEERR